MFKKWKEEWWVRNSEVLAQAYASEEASLKQEFEEHLSKDRIAFNNKLEELRKEGLELETRLVQLGVKKLELDEMERRINDKKVELARLNDELLQQIRIAEAKSSPSNIWIEAFSQGVSKTWDLLLPTMTGNIETLKKKIYEDATMDAVTRMNGKKK